MAGKTAGGTGVASRHHAQEYGFKDTPELLLAAFPVLSKGFKEVLIIPSSVESVVKGAVQGTIFLINKTEGYKESKEYIYFLSAPAAQVLMMLVNKWVEHRKGRWNYRLKSSIEGPEVVTRTQSAHMAESSIR